MNNSMKYLPEQYLSVSMRQRVQEAKARGNDVIDFTIGDPDLVCPEFLIKDLIKEIYNPENHRYPFMESKGLPEYRQAISKMYSHRYGIELNPETQVMALIGSKEGSHYLALSLCQHGDFAIICEPSYPTYAPSARLAGADVFNIPLLEEYGYLPELDLIPTEVLKKTKLFFVNYPNNPTGAIASLNFYEKLVELAQRYEFIVCNDNAYGDIYFGENKPLSLLEVPNALKIAVEMNTLSKTFNICGWRIGMLCGNEDVIQKVLRIKQITDAGVFMPIQRSVSKALLSSEDYVKLVRKTYKDRRDILVSGLRSLGYYVYEPQAGMFVWMKTPNGYTSIDFSTRLLKNYGIACNPGIGYGSYGEGHVRFSLSVMHSRITEALNRFPTINEIASRHSGDEKNWFHQK